jgi:hypothetical protein
MLYALLLRSGRPSPGAFTKITVTSVNAFPAFKTATLGMIRAQGAIVGWRATSVAFAEALHD